MATCDELASAKVNLTLKVGPVGQDGFHPLQSLVVFADWEDQVSISGHERLVLGVSGPRLKDLENEPVNLALKAAYALRAVAEAGELGAKIHLKKHLPIAAGLGGGSADAAAALRALNRYWDLGLSLKDMAQIGSVVGSDVPACVYSKPLMMSGRGETVKPLMAWPRMSGVLVNPGVPVSTADVFRQYDASNPVALGPVEAVNAGDFKTAIQIIKAQSNDLQSTACAICPEIETVLDELNNTNDCVLARMSGSGASCFALYETAGQSEVAAQRLEQKHPDWMVKAVQFSGAVS